MKQKQRGTPHARRAAQEQGNPGIVDVLEENTDDRCPVPVGGEMAMTGTRLALKTADLYPSVTEDH